MSCDPDGAIPVVDKQSNDCAGPMHWSLAKSITAKLETPVSMAVFGSVSASLSAVSSDSSQACATSKLCKWGSTVHVGCSQTQWKAAMIKWYIIIMATFQHVYFRLFCLG